jgi:hypothetical protein
MVVTSEGTYIMTKDCIYLIGAEGGDSCGKSGKVETLD